MDIAILKTIHLHLYLYFIIFQLFSEDSSYSGDSYTKYTSHPANKHDDSKLREKFGMVPGEGASSASHRKIDPYQFTRSTAQPAYSSAQPDKRRSESVMLLSHPILFLKQ